MNAVSIEISESIIELQNLKNLHNFSLGGGTNIALWFNH